MPALHGWHKYAKRARRNGYFMQLSISAVLFCNNKREWHPLLEPNQLLGFHSTAVDSIMPVQVVIQAISALSSMSTTTAGVSAVCRDPMSLEALCGLLMSARVLPHPSGTPEEWEDIALEVRQLALPFKIPKSVTFPMSLAA
eukprot:scaffold351885_cov40-Prasinocladus_malaysianus.AAC.1